MFLGSIGFMSSLDTSRRRSDDTSAALEHGHSVRLYTLLILTAYWYSEPVASIVRVPGNTENI